VRGSGVSAGFWRDAGAGGDGLLGAAGVWVFRRGEDLWPVPGQCRGRGAERVADLPGDGGAGQPAVAVGVLAGVDAELVTGELGGLLVVGGDSSGAAAGWQRGQFQQRRWCLGAVEASVGDNRAVVGAAGSAVVWVQVVDEAGAGGAERVCPGVRDAVGVAGVGRSPARQLAGQRRHRPVRPGRLPHPWSTGSRT
jgi:hypothetical protein